MIQTDFVNRTRFKLDGRVIVDPVNWNDSDKEYARNETYFGLVATFSNNLIFVKNGSDYITFVKKTYGINKDIVITKEEMNPKTDIWELVYTGYLDLSTYSLENNQVSVKINSGGLQKLLKARESEQVEISRGISIDGVAITDPIPEITVSLKNKAIQIKSFWKSEKTTTDNYLEMSDTSTDGNTGARSAGIPFPIITNAEGSVDQAISYGSYVNERGHDYGISKGTSGQMLYANAETVYNLTSFSIKNLSFKFDLVKNDRIDTCRIKVFLAKFTNGVAYDIGAKTLLYEMPSRSVMQANNGKTINVPDYISTSPIVLQIGESLGLIAEMTYDFTNQTNASRLFIKMSEITGEISSASETNAPDSLMTAYLYKDLLKQVVKIDTNDNDSFKSSYLENKLIGVSHGINVRQFPKDAEYYKPLSTSFKDAFNSYDSIEPIGMGIEIIDGKEKVVIENIEYFFDRNITVRIGQVSNVKRYVATEFYYSSAIFGSEKGGDYEEANGLDEFNTQTTYTTSNTRLTKIYEKIAKYRKDGTGKELARRRPYSTYATTDTTYDNDIFMLDLKPGSYGQYEEKGAEQYASVTGIYSPETSNGFYFSAKSSLLHHGKFIHGGLELQPNESIRFGSSKYNSDLALNGIGERDPVLNKDLDKKLFTPDWIEFNYKCDFDLIKQIRGKTVIAGKEVLNFYGLVEFTNEIGSKETGFLFNLKPNGEGEWKLLSA